MTAFAGERATDEALARAAAGGDGDAFAALYERYFERLHDFVLRIVHDSSLAADVSQAALIRAWRTIQDRGAPEHTKAWLFTIARNEAIDQLRKRRREVGLPSESDAERRALTIVDESRLADPEALTGEADLVELVWAAARALNPREYALLDMHLRQDLSAEEIADAMGLRVGAVYTALSRLRDALEEAVVTELLVRHGANECQRLGALLVGRMGAGEEQARSLRRAVKKHLKSCDTCNDRRRRLTAPAALFGALAPVGLPGTLAPIRERLESAGGSSSRGGVQTRARDWWFVAGRGERTAVVAGPVIVVGILAVLITLLVRGGSSQTIAAAAVRDPSDVASTSHAVNVESEERRITIEWTRQTDVAGYSVIWTEDEGAIPDKTVDVDGATTRVVSPELDPGEWYFVLRTKGANGDWTSTVHLGPFRIVGPGAGATDTPTPGNATAPTDTPTPKVIATATPTKTSAPQPTATPTPDDRLPTPTPERPDEPTAAACVMTNTLVFQRVEVVPGSHHDGIFLLTLTNQDGAPVVGATVMGHTIKSDGIPTFPVAQTGPGGQITYVMRTTAFGLNTLFIDAIEFPGCAWDAANSQTENGFDAEP